MSSSQATSTASSAPKVITIHDNATLVIPAYGETRLEKSFKPESDKFEVHVPRGISDVSARVPVEPNGATRTRMVVGKSTFRPATKETLLQHTIESHGWLVAYAQGADALTIQPIAILDNNVLAYRFQNGNEAVLSLERYRLTPAKGQPEWKPSLADIAAFELLDHDAAADVTLRAKIDATASVSYDYAIEEQAGDELRGTLHRHITVTNNTPLPLENLELKLALSARGGHRDGGLQFQSASALHFEGGGSAPVNESNAGVLTLHLERETIAAGPGLRQSLAPWSYPATATQAVSLNVTPPAAVGFFDLGVLSPDVQFKLRNPKNDYLPAGKFTIYEGDDVVASDRRYDYVVPAGSLEIKADRPLKQITAHVQGVVKTLRTGNYKRDSSGYNGGSEVRDVLYGVKFDTVITNKGKVDRGVDVVFQLGRYRKEVDKDSIQVAIDGVKAIAELDAAKKTLRVRPADGAKNAPIVRKETGGVPRRISVELNALHQEFRPHC